MNATLTPRAIERQKLAQKLRRFATAHDVAFARNAEASREGGSRLIPLKSEDYRNVQARGAAWLRRTASDRWRAGAAQVESVSLAPDPHGVTFNYRLAFKVAKDERVTRATTPVRVRYAANSFSVLDEDRTAQRVRLAARGQLPSDGANDRRGMQGVGDIYWANLRAALDDMASWRPGYGSGESELQPYFYSSAILKIAKKQPLDAKEMQHLKAAETDKHGKQLLLRMLDEVLGDGQQLPAKAMKRFRRLRQRITGQSYGDLVREDKDRANRKTARKISADAKRTAEFEDLPLANKRLENLRDSLSDAIAKAGEAEQAIANAVKLARQQVLESRGMTEADKKELDNEILKKNEEFSSELRAQLAKAEAIALRTRDGKFLTMEVAKRLVPSYESAFTAIMKLSKKAMNWAQTLLAKYTYISKTETPVEVESEKGLQKILDKSQKAETAESEFWGQREVADARKKWLKPGMPPSALPKGVDRPVIEKGGLFKRVSQTAAPDPYQLAEMLEESVADGRMVLEFMQDDIDLIEQIFSEAETNAALPEPPTERDVVAARASAPARFGTATRQPIGFYRAARKREAAAANPGRGALLAQGWAADEVDAHLRRQ